jgi:hypothetical protein
LEGEMEKNLILGPVLTLFVINGSVHGADPELRITMRVVNNAKVPDWLLRKAEKDAEYILGRAGVEAAWLHCPPRSVLDGPLNPCHRSFAPTEFWLRVVPQKPPGLGDETLGFAIHEAVRGIGGGYAYVSYPMVEALSNSVQASASQVMGVAIAHEIGHLLLGAAHSPTGIMCARWRRAHFGMMSIGRLLFTPEQAIQIRAGVMQRVAQASPQRER